MNATTVYAGLDIHATNTLIQSINGQGSPVGQQEVPTRADQLISWARNYPRGQLHIILEQGTHARWIVNALAPWVAELVICDPGENALIHGSGNKNDRSDAHKLARLPRLGEYKSVWWQPMEARHLFKSRIKMFLRQRQANASGIQRLISWLRHIGVGIPTGQSRFSFKRAGHWIRQINSEAHQLLAQQKLGFIRYHHTQSLEIFRDIRRQGEKYWEIAEFQGIPGIGPVGGASVFGVY